MQSPIVNVYCAEGEQSIRGSHVLLAVGRRPNTDDLNLQAAGVLIDARGYIQVNEQLQTSNPSVWVLGDCNGRGAFTHTAYNDYEILAGNLLDGKNRQVGNRIPAHALFIDPPLAQIGITEDEVRRSGRKALMAIRPMTEVGRL